MTRISLKRPAFWVTLLLVSILVIGCASMEEKRDKFIAQGKQLFETGDYVRARLQFMNAIQIDPKSAEAYLWAGKTDLKLTNFKAAFGALSKAVELNPDLIEAQIILGQILVLGRQLDNAQAKANLVLAKEPNNTEALLLAATVAAAQKQPQKALDYLGKIIRLDPHKISAYLLQASLEEKDHPQAAVSTLEAGLKANPKALDLYLARARLADSQKQFDQAEAMILKAIDLEPKNTKLQTELARHYARAGKWDKVEEALRRNLSLEPDKEDHVKELARFLAEKGRLKDTEKVLKDFLAQHPGKFGIQFAMADFYFTVRQTGKGIRVLQQIIDKEPHSPPGLQAKNKLAAQLLARNQTKEAEKLIEEVLKDNPKDMEAVRLQGQLALLRKDGLKAVTNFRVLTQDLPNDPGAWLLLAQAHMLNKEPEQAKEKARKALELKPGFLEARSFLYGIFLEAKDYNGAIQTIKGYLNFNDKDVFNLSALGEVHVLKGDYAQAQAVYQKIVTVEPKNPMGYFKLGLLSRQQKKPEQALKYWEQALAHQPNFMPALQQIVATYLTQKEPEKALGAVQGDLSRSPNNPQIQQLLGELFLAQKHPREAIAPLEKAMAGNPNPGMLALLAKAYHSLPDQEQVIRQLEEGSSDPKASPYNFLILSSFYEKRGQLDKAKSLYESLIQRDLFPALSRNNLAYLLAEHEPTPANLERATKLAAESLEENPDEPGFLDTKGWILCKQGEFAQAKPILEQAVGKATNNPTVLYHLGYCAAKSGDAAKARESLEKAMALKREFPEQAEAKKLLDTLPPAGKP